jgi:hypothetical protein
MDTALGQLQTADAHEERLRPASTVRFAEIDGLIVILDLSSDDYFILNSTGTSLWRALLDHNGDADMAARATTARFSSADLPEALEDAGRAIEEWRARGFLDSGPCPTAPRPEERRPFPGARRFLELSASWSLVRTAFDFRWKGFGRTYLQCASLPLPPPCEDVGKLIEAAASAFIRAENLFHFARAPQDCLPRSLALFRFCRSVGLRVGHRIGGQRFPQLSMHAWVEHANQVVLDDPSYRRDLTILASIPP